MNDKSKQLLTQANLDKIISLTKYLTQQEMLFLEVARCRRVTTDISYKQLEELCDKLEQAEKLGILDSEDGRKTFNNIYSIIKKDFSEYYKNYGHKLDKFLTKENA